MSWFRNERKIVDNLYAKYLRINCTQVPNGYLQNVLIWTVVSDWADDVYFPEVTRQVYTSSSWGLATVKVEVWVLSASSVPSMVPSMTSSPFFHVTVALASRPEILQDTVVLTPINASLLIAWTSERYWLSQKWTYIIGMSRFCWLNKFNFLISIEESINPYNVYHVWWPFLP